MAEQSLTQVCKDSLLHPELLAGCNLFVESVCAAMGYDKLFSKSDQTDGMIAKFSSRPFVYIGKNPAEAIGQAKKGMLVLGGLTKANMSYKNKQGHMVNASMGHIVVVAPGGPSLPREIKLADGTPQSCRGGYPLCYGGAAIPKYRIASQLSVDAVFPSAKLNEVEYAYLELPAN